MDVLYKMCNFISTENPRWPPHHDNILTYKPMGIGIKRLLSETTTLPWLT